MIDQKVLDFVDKHRISVLTTLLSDGSPHSASLHYSADLELLEFYFITEKTTRKLQALSEKKQDKASLVIGFSEEEFVTLQVEGVIQILEEQASSQRAWNSFIEKYPQTAARQTDPTFVILSFQPTWWRFSEFRPKPPRIISSE